MDEPDPAAEEMAREIELRASAWMQVARVASAALGGNPEAPHEVAWRNPAPRSAASTAEMLPHWDGD